MFRIIITTLFICLTFKIGISILEAFIWLMSKSVNKSVDYMFNHEKEILETIKTRENKNLFIKKIKSKIKKERLLK